MIDTWPLPCARLLARSGPPEPLEAAADILEGLAGTDHEETNAGRRAAVQELRQLADAARVCLGAVERMGCRFDFDRGHAVVIRGGRGAPTKLVNLVVAGVLEDLNPPEWFTQATYDQVRAELDIPRDELSDLKIRKAIEKHARR